MNQRPASVGRIDSRENRYARRGARRWPAIAPPRAGSTPRRSQALLTHTSTLAGEMPSCRPISLELNPRPTSRRHACSRGVGREIRSVVEGATSAMPPI
jgi:hypothetical protein